MSAFSDLRDGTFSPECVWEAKAGLGEGPIWSASDRSLYFVDIPGRAIHRFTPSTGTRASWTAPSRPTFVVPVEGGGFLCGLEDGLRRFDPSDGGFGALARIEPSLADYWEEVTTSFHDADAHHLYLSPDTLRRQLEDRTWLRLSSISQDQPHEFRAQGADTAARSLREAEPEPDMDVGAEADMEAEAGVEIGVEVDGEEEEDEGWTCTCC